MATAGRLATATAEASMAPVSVFRIGMGLFLSFHPRTAKMA
jgi:hypothetical protein